MSNDMRAEWEGLEVPLQGMIKEERICEECNRDLDEEEQSQCIRCSFWNS